MVRIHFLNVGHGDCTIIEHASGHLTMLDINNADQLDDDSRRELAESYGITGIDYEQSLLFARALNQSFRKAFLQPKGYDVTLTDPVNYYLAHWQGKSIFRFILSHPDLDHIRGVKRLAQERIPIRNFWDTDHNIEAKDCKSDGDKAEWAQYQKLRQSKADPKVFLNYRDDQNKYWNQDDAGGQGDGLYILAPTRKLTIDANEAEDPNAHSYVIWFEYAGIKVVLGGAATEAVWKSIHDNYGKDLKCDVLKASHHGRDTGYYQPAVEAMSPQYTVVSVGKKPESDASNKYRQYCENVWSTRWRGDIVLTIQPNGQANIESQFNRQPPALAAAKAIAPAYPAFGGWPR